MDLLDNYGSDDSDGEQKKVKKLKVSHAVIAAPGVHEDHKAMQRYIDPTTKVLNYNPRADVMWREVEGPQHPGRRGSTLGLRQGIVQNAVTGFVEPTSMNEYAFDEQYNTFQRMGYAQDPSENGTRAVIGDSSAIEANNGNTYTLIARKPKNKEQVALRRKRKELTGDVEDPDSYQGPWASYYFEEQEAPQVATEEQKAHAQKIIDKRKREAREEPEEEDEKSVFHGKELYDYQGRSYVDCPSHIKVRDDAPPAKNFAPKKLLHTWSGHSKGVSAIRFFPKSGHLLLSSSMDGTVKLWDVHNQRKCLRTFTGHDQAVKDISFSPDGRRFISCSYDRYVKCWDTETGQCISRHTSKKIPVCVKWFPEEGAHDHEFLCGQSNKLVVQWDLRENKIVQQYDEHLGPVNSITFIDNNRRFLSTSDDKKVLIWEYGIPVVVKHLAEPDMHSMPATTLHPNGKFWLGQSQDNQILCYGASGKFKLNTKKRFRGHLSAGYACQVDVSPDGKLVMSGDAEGRVFFWDWRSMRVFAKLKAHDKVTIGCAWHPLEQSRVATCSWDGTIKYWD